MAACGPLGEQDASVWQEADVPGVLQSGYDGRDGQAPGLGPGGHVGGFGRAAVATGDEAGPRTVASVRCQRTIAMVSSKL